MHTTINILYHAIPEEISRSAIADLLVQLPEDMQNRALRYQSNLAAHQFIIGRLLLQDGLQKFDSKDNLGELSYTKHNKPLLPHTQFNISHSQRLVICAFSSQGEIGVDVEIPTSININNLRHSFTEDEWLHINQDPARLYQLWCRKEAVIKASPYTLKDLHKIEVSCLESTISIDNKFYHLQDLSYLKKYEGFGAVCTEFPVANIHFERRFYE